jgi:hypothetical protein
MEDTKVRETETELPVALWGLAGVVGLLMALFGMILVPLPWILSGLRQQGMGVLISGYGFLGLSLGVALGVSAVQGIRRRPSRSFRSRWLWLIFLLGTLLLAVAAVLMPFDTAGLGFAMLHVGLLTLPALLLLSLLTVLIGPGVAARTRQLILMMAGGALSTLGALPLEMVGLLLGGALVVVVALAFPGGESAVSSLMDTLARWSVAPPTDPEEILSLAASPIVLSILVLTLAVVAPLVEELLKAGLVVIAGLWIRPGAGQTFLWGAACGIGFAVIEGVANGAIGLESSTGWLGGLGTRLLATAMHALTSGVLALGWRGLWTRRWWLVPLAFLGAAAYHGLWNFNVVLALGGAGVTSQIPALGGGLLILGGTLTVGMMLFTVFTLVALPLWLRYRRPKTEA